MTATPDVVRPLVANEEDKDDVGIAGTPNGDGKEIIVS
jgi:hypothetical protein